MTTYKYKAVIAKQAKGHEVFSFAATPSDILEFADIDRVGRDEQGELRGFQRHQLASHIKEIRDYLARQDAILPNAVIVAFIDGATVRESSKGIADVTISVGDKKPGFVVDGQQRLTALSGIDKPGFQVFVSALICKDYNELRQQFVLINSTRPLPKSLIYELLPTVDGLPERFTSRKFSARVVDRLNYTKDSVFYGEIRQHTNPQGVLSDTALQKLVMNSASDGAIREFLSFDGFEGRSVTLINEFFGAVKKVFNIDWVGMTPKTSRLRHGVGLVAMGFVMELLYATEGATTSAQFEPGLKLLLEHTAWTSGHWRLSTIEVRSWNGLQNTPTDIHLLANYLVRTLKRELRKTRVAVEV
jgi:DGQHR domain-containing protein